MALSVQTINDLQMVRSVGKLKSYEAFLTFKIELEDILPKFLGEQHMLRIYFVRAYPISSYVLGYLFKLRNTDKIKIEIVVDDLRLFMFFEEIDLVDEFQIKIMEA
ncbi:hypothetical protein [Helicobacter typhlonius]|uniref:Uncharacterized protein n=1 Tax=Helicobacter typhlonius TaxID=76936 RepID=A0A099UAW1_9HELI|nr:hypothetical protein [Helicobacter typhlonius]TLD79526.1 hypothetical protein LS75_000875 [Helicobacter typhlonius]CUU39357.1 FIG00711943: Hypothetical protein [Helicobacter typhlonius]HCD72944.1 hypothetical protein [Helicobacter sp.]